MQDSAAPLKWSLTPAQIRSNCNAQVALASRRFTAIQAVAPARATFQNTVLAIEDMGADLGDRLATEQMLGYVSSDKAVRDASRQCGQSVSSLFNRTGADPKIYALLRAVRARRTLRYAADRKLLELYIVGAKRAGAGLSPGERKQFLDLENQLTVLGQQFNENVGSSTASITITKSQSIGLPSDLLANAKPAADGYVIPATESTYPLFMNYERDATAREAFYRVYQKRGAPANVAILEKALGLRRLVAHMLGYKTWADYVLDNAMAKSPGRVLSFLTDLDARVLPAARTEMLRLGALKAKDTGNARINAWDVNYYDNKLRETRYSVDSSLIREYFPAAHTVDAVLAIYSRILGIRFRKVAHPNTAYADIIEYLVTDRASGRFLGSCFLDLYPRPGKFAHFANFAFLPTRRLHDGSFRAPVSIIIGNWPQPAPGRPSLLSHQDLLVFFHEFGHTMAALLATVPYETLAGFRQDFVEAPSQMLENFVWDPTVLKQISSNAKTGKPLSDALAKKLISTRFVDDAYYTTRQIQLGMADMLYHTSTVPVDTTAVFKQVASRYTPIPMPEGVYPQASFLHLFGYDAAYYGYLWSRVYAQDMFTAFKKGGLESPGVGMRYRVDILEPAQTYEPDVLIKRFLGRPMSPAAFYSGYNKKPN